MHRYDSAISNAKLFHHNIFVSSDAHKSMFQKKFMGDNNKTNMCKETYTMTYLSLLPTSQNSIIRTINDPIHVGRFYQVHIHVGRLLSGSYKCYILPYDFVIHDLFHNSVLYISYWSFLILMLVLIKKKYSVTITNKIQQF